jgi:hypothetical protein
MAKSKFAGLKPVLDDDLGEEKAPTPEPAKTSPKTTRTTKTTGTTRKTTSRTTKKPATSKAKTAAPKVDPLAPPKKVTRRGHTDYIAITRYLDRQIMLRLNAVEDHLRLTKNRDINQSQLIDEVLAAWLAMWEGEDPAECFERSKKRIDRYPDLN